MPKLKVIGYSKEWNSHTCEGIDLPCDLVDIEVSSDLPEKLDSADLIGKTIQYDLVHPFVVIAHNCKIVEEDADGQ